MSKELVKPVRILTEEEFQEIERVSGIMLNRDNENMTTRDVGLNKMFIDLINSHRSLLSANAELSYKNQKLNESLKKVNDHLEGVMHPKRLVMLDCPWMHKILSQALEELK